MHENRVAIVANASFYVGPALAMKLADVGFDLVLGDPDPEVISHLEKTGRDSWVVDQVADLSEPSSAPRLLDMAMDAYGRVDSAVFFSGDIVMGRVLDSTDADFEKVVAGNLEAPYRALRTFARPMVDAGSGQILAITSSSGIKPTPNAALYSATRSGANMLVRNFAAEVAPDGVQVNAVGTNFMDFPMFREATGGDDPDVMAKITRNVPMGRLGTMDEFADFCLAFLDGRARFHTGQVVGFDGGWSAT